MPRVLCIIPARGGSKRIPGKNLVKVGGLPLVVHSIRHALESKRVDRVVISTDDSEIAKISKRAGAGVVLRPPEISGDAATSESALLHALDTVGDPDIVVFLQPTSPVRRSFDIDRAIAQLERQKLDSLFSACANNKLLWRLPPSGPASLNYDYRKRKREQEFPPEFRENGSIYVFRPAVLRRHHNRLGGRMGIYVMPEWASFQLDQPWEARLLTWILREQKELQGLPE
jgi:N-acylneuraminate cytidylyltransferase